MTLAGWAQIIIFLVVLTALTPLLGGYMARVYQGGEVRAHRGPQVWPARVGAPVERLLYRLLRVAPEEEQDWKSYARSVLLFSLASWLVLYVVLRTQGSDPFNPQHFASGPWALSFNTASSFVSNTSWQFYGGETTLSYFSQMAGITVASFTSCAVGMAVAVALIRGLVRRETDRLGNFWVDLTRSLLYVLIPLSILGGLFLVSQGAIQNLSHYLRFSGPTHLGQTIAMGPVGSQEVIKLLSGDGGGFFNTNSAHPFENPTGLASVVEALLMLLIPAAMTYTFGRMIGRARQGWALYAAMLVLFVIGVGILYAAEAHGTPAMHAAGLHGANLQDKEQRFGTAGSALFVGAGTAGGDGAVNSGIEAFTGLGSAVAMANIMTGEVIFGGPGSGLFGVLLLVVLAVFIAGLMVGRTPEYLGKKLGAREVKLAALGTLFVPATVLGLTAVAISSHAGRPGDAAHRHTHVRRAADRVHHHLRAAQLPRRAVHRAARSSPHHAPVPIATGSRSPPLMPRVRAAPRGPRTGPRRCLRSAPPPVLRLRSRPAPAPRRVPAWRPSRSGRGSTRPWRRCDGEHPRARPSRPASGRRRR
jgi:K+-transporting ATPase ATPase A chain